jgi:predicted Zn-dependent protease
MPVTVIESVPRSNAAARKGVRMLAAALACLALAACNTFMRGDSPIGTASVTADASAPKDNDTSEHARIVASYGGIYHDPKLEKMLTEIVTKLVAASDNPNQPYRITILNAPAVNAFALPGGSLYVTRGLMALANDASELAAVLAHEMAHITADHAAQRANKARTAIIVNRVVSDSIDDKQAGQVALASSQRTLASFSRQQELEADAIGIRTIAKAGYDPYAAARFLAAMAHFAQYRASTSIPEDKRPEFLASHPTTPDRIAQANKAAEALGVKRDGATDRDKYLETIDGMLFSDDSNQGYVRGRSFLHAALGIAFTVPDGYAIDNTNEAVLATAPDGTALRVDGVNLPEQQTLVDYLSSGWVNGLARETIREFQINGLKAVSATARAKGWAFRITLIRVGVSATYRFIFASERETPEFARAAEVTAASFRQLTEKERAQLKPLRIEVVRVGFTDTQESLAKRMRNVDRPLDLFRAINDIKPGAKLNFGARVKIVTD